MRDAAMPRHDQHVVMLEPAAKHIGVGKNRAEHQRPGDDPSRTHRAAREHFVATKDCLTNQCAGDSVSDCVHRSECVSRCALKAWKVYAPILWRRQKVSPNRAE